MNSALIERILKTDLGVAPAYRYSEKCVEVQAPVELDATLLKWYDVYPQGLPVPPEIHELARRPLQEGTLRANGLGFVVLHRCGDSFYFLIVSTWRNENELWETVWYKNGDAMAGFEAFDRPVASLPTYCVWELVPVWSEQQSWVRFLQSAREQRDVEVWLGDTMRETTTRNA